MENVNDIEARKLVTPEGRVSFPHLFIADAPEGSGKPAYSVNLMIPKSDAEGVARIKQALKNAIEFGKTSVWKGKIPAKLDLSLWDGDEGRGNKEPRPEEAGCLILKAKSDAQYARPGVVDKNRNVIDDETEVYPGCYGRASVKFHPYSTAGNQGVTCILIAFQKLRDGEPLAGGQSPAEIFDDGVGESYPDPEPKMTGNPDIDAMLG